MKRQTIFVALLLALFHLPVSAQQVAVQPARTRQSKIEHSSDAQLTQPWGLRDDELVHYRELMQVITGACPPMCIKWTQEVR